MISVLSRVSLFWWGGLGLANVIKYGGNASANNMLTRGEGGRKSTRANVICITPLSMVNSIPLAGNS